jgi:hypothetical protein
MLSFQVKGPKWPISQPPRLAQNPLGYMITQCARLDNRAPRSFTLTDSQGIPDITDGPQEPYDGIMQIICIALADAADMDPESPRWRKPA